MAYSALAASIRLCSPREGFHPGWLKTPSTLRRERVVGIADYLARHLEALRPEEASAARVLRELVKNQRLG